MFSKVFILSMMLIPKSYAIEYKSWQTFQSNFGYSFEYPDCWIPKIDAPDAEGKIANASEIFVSEGTCPTPSLDPEIPNGIGFQVWLKKYSKQEIASEKKSLNKKITEQIKNKTHFALKRRKVDGAGDVFAFVEFDSKVKKTLLWRAELFCSNRRISITAAPTRDPSPQLLQKLGAGELSLPEPYKRIFETITCNKQNGRAKFGNLGFR